MPERRVHFLQIAVSAVVALTLVVTLVLARIAFVQHAHTVEERAVERSEALAVLLAVRVQKSSLEAEQATFRMTSRELPGVEILTVNAQGDAGGLPLETRSAETYQQLWSEPRGTLASRLGDAAYASAPLPRERRLVVLSRLQDETPGARATIFVLGLLLLLAGIIAAIFLGGNVESDIAFVRKRIDAMTQFAYDPKGEAIPARGFDEVGRLTAAFNELTKTFAAAHEVYQVDLKRARDLDRDRALFLAAMSHELRSPLNAVLGFTEVLLTEVDGELSEDAKENAEQILASGRNLRRLVDSLLEYSALEGGHVELRKEPIDLVQLLEDVASEQRVLADQKGLVLDLSSTYGDLTIDLDPLRIRQVLINLISNAVKFTESGSIHLRLEREGGAARISIEDTGVGIAPDKVEVIFDEYEQLGPSKTRGQGFGLGLAIARRIVLLHHGDLSVHSTLGRGSEFVITLPLGALSTPAPALVLSDRPSSVLGPGDHR
jgi:signal transduction histidine kinase